MADKSKLKHNELEKFVSETLSKREPCPAMVLAWGWMMKQGEGGLFHSDAFKQRFFVLARVPHATVLIYYGERTMDEENILGFIDLRKVQQVREASKPVAVDGAVAKAGGSGGGGGFMSKLFSKSGGAGTVTRSVVELVTPGRVYTLSPASINMPAPMTTSAALAASSSTGSKPLYLFGWPFPVPPMPAPGSEGEESEASVAASFLDSSGPGGSSVAAEEAFAQWRDVLATAVAAEKATRTYPVNTLVDSTGQLPQRVFLRTTPCELAIVSMEDKDLCFAALPYNDLLKWDCPVDSEIHVTARTRARLVAKPDRSGFSSQRPTRPTCHFVFKCSESKAIASVIDNHLRALAKQLSGLGDGADEAEVAAAAAESGGNFNAVDEPPTPGSAPAASAGAGSGSASAPGGEDDAGASKAKLTGKKPSTPKKSADYEDEEEEEAPKKKSSSSSSRSSSKKKSLADEEDEEEEEVSPKKKSSSRSASKKKSLADEDDEEEEEAAPKKKSSSATKSKKKSLADEEDEEEEDDPAPKKKSSASKTKSKKKSLADEDDDEDA